MKTKRKALKINHVEYYKRCTKASQIIFSYTKRK